MVSFCDGKRITDLHVKPTDRHRYLHYTLAHPNHTKRSIILRLSRICFYKNYFEKYLQKINSWFRVRGSADNFVKRQVLMPMGSYGLNIEDSIWVLPFDNIEVCTFYSAYILHFMDYWSGLFFRIAVMEDEFV